MTIYTKPRLKLTPAEERAADVMEWVHARLWWDLALTDPGKGVSRVTSRHSCWGLEDIGPNPSLAAIALLEQVSDWPEWSTLEADDPLRLFMHEEGEGDR